MDGLTFKTALHLSSTPVSLLERLKTAAPDSEDWRRLNDIYLPMIRKWLARVPGMQPDDVSDLAQEVLVVVFKELPKFERQREGSFRAWLRCVKVNRVRAHWKERRRQPSAAGGDATGNFLAQLEDPDSELAREWDCQHNQAVFKQLLAIVKPDFEVRTWNAFERFALDDIPAANVAAEFGISENAVFLAKSRILERLREEAAGLIE